MSTTAERLENERLDAMTSAERIAYLENKLAGEKAEAAKRDRAEQFNLVCLFMATVVASCFCYWFYTKI